MHTFVTQMRLCNDFTTNLHIRCILKYPSTYQTIVLSVVLLMTWLHQQWISLKKNLHLNLSLTLDFGLELALALALALALSLSLISYNHGNYTSNVNFNIKSFLLILLIIMKTTTTLRMGSWRRYHRLPIMFFLKKLN